MEKQRWEEPEKRREEKIRSAKRSEAKRKMKRKRKRKRREGEEEEEEEAEPSGQMRDKKLYAVVARSTFRSQKCKKVTVSDHFWKLRLMKKSTPLPREANFKVKMYRTHQVRNTFGS